MSVCVCVSAVKMKPGMSPSLSSSITRYLDPDMYSMMEDNSDTVRSTKFRKLTEAICGLVSAARSLALQSPDGGSLILVCDCRLMITAW